VALPRELPSNRESCRAMEAGQCGLLAVPLPRRDVRPPER